MLSRRGHRLSRFRKNKRRLRERLRQRIFFRDKVVPEAMEKPRVLVLTGAGISAESGISYLSRRRWPVGRTSG
ncbi:NAD-dependent deacetylase [Escherichia coli]|uniref:NAD-dependent deacetylase n=1 Tax=Escherichia coli TaxID=562 RepID=A0A377F5G2_ECOLX|nr:NAD-dependent deacetylase [Escherichia coli]